MHGRLYYGHPYGYWVIEKDDIKEEVYYEIAAKADKKPPRSLNEIRRCTITENVKTHLESFLNL